MSKYIAVVTKASASLQIVPAICPYYRVFVVFAVLGPPSHVWKSFVVVCSGLVDVVYQKTLRNFSLEGVALSILQHEVFTFWAHLDDVDKICIVRRW